MIDILGTKRVLILVILLGVNLFLAGMVYLYLSSERSEKQLELRRVQSQVSSLEEDISRLQVEFDQLEWQQGKYEALRDRGFFSNQERRQAEKTLEAIQEKAGIVSAVANISPGVIENNEEAAKADYKVLKSPVNVQVEALDDVDVFTYIYLIEKYFPGHISVERIKLERKAEVTGTILRAIASGENPALVEASIGMTWRTMIPVNAVIGEGRQ